MGRRFLRHSPGAGVFVHEFELPHCLRNAILKHLNFFGPQIADHARALVAHDKIEEHFRCGGAQAWFRRLGRNCQRKCEQEQGEKSHLESAGSQCTADHL